MLQFCESRDIIVSVIKMTIGERIKKRRTEIGMTVDDLADAIGKNRATIYRYESADIEKLPITILEPLAKVLRTTPAELMGWSKDESNISAFPSPTTTEDVVRLPVIGDIAAGFDKIANEDWSGETVEIPKSFLKGRPEDDFIVLTVDGNSMYPLYLDGDKVVIKKQSTLNRSGEIGAIIYEGECVSLKKIEYVEGEDWLKMIPLNPEFMPKTISGADLELCRVIGIPVLLIREID